LPRGPTLSPTSLCGCSPARSRDQACQPTRCRAAHCGRNVMPAARRTRRTTSGSCSSAQRCRGRETGPVGGEDAGGEGGWHRSFSAREGKGTPDRPAGPARGSAHSASERIWSKSSSPAAPHPFFPSGTFGRNAGCGADSLSLFSCEWISRSVPVTSRYLRMPRGRVVAAAPTRLPTQA
jgi:hypothetical protein